MRVRSAIIGGTERITAAMDRKSIAIAVGLERMVHVAAATTIKSSTPKDHQRHPLRSNALHDGGSGAGGDAFNGPRSTCCLVMDRSNTKCPHYMSADITESSGMSL
jgi:hypothetical protein